MTTATKQARDHTHLRYVGRNRDVVTFSAPSASDPERTNTVRLDLTTGDTLCDCRFCANHPDVQGGCWLSRNVVAAWWARVNSLETTDRLRAIDAAYSAVPPLNAGQALRHGLVRAELARRAG